MKKIDIESFAYKRGGSEWAWEEQRDIETVILEPGKGWQGDPGSIKLFYWKKTWPEERWELAKERGTGGLGWAKTDDWFNGEYRQALIKTSWDSGKIAITFRPLSEEFPEAKDYAVKFRRTMKLRLEFPGNAGSIEKISIYTVSPAKQISLIIESKDKADLSIKELYNCEIVRTEDLLSIQLTNYPTNQRKRAKLNVSIPLSPFSGDEPLVTLGAGKDSFTFNPREALENPVFVPHLGALVKKASEKRSYDRIVKSLKNKKTIYGMVGDHKEQSLKGALGAMPEPDLTYYFVGCKHSRQKFMLFPDGNILIRDNPRLMFVAGKDSPAIKRKGNWCLRFGLEGFKLKERSIDENKLPILTSVFKQGALSITQTVFAVPLHQSILSGETAPDSPAIAMVKLAFKNSGKKPVSAKLDISALNEAGYTNNNTRGGVQEEVFAKGDLVYAQQEGKEVLRFSVEKNKGKTVVKEKNLVYECGLPAGKSAELIVRLPFVCLENSEELDALENKKFGKELEEARKFWRGAAAQGCEIKTPEKIINDFHATHLAHIFITDEAMPDDNRLVNTCVGTVSYGNFSNEACMIINDLDRRGLHDEAERRLGIYFKYQGTVPQPGNFTDYNGMFFGAGGYECGHYNQHHGWVLWCAGEHFRLSGNSKWLLANSEKLVAGCDWVIRQRSNTKKDKKNPEYGFLPAGSLEDVTEFYYWLSTNTLTWWGLDSCARALFEAGHPEGKRLVKEAGEHAEDLRAGFVKASSKSPVVRLRDGTYVPHYPSRLYLRGRDYGWIREVLEGAIYLIISGLFDPSSEEATQILKDYEDNRYTDEKSGYGLKNFKKDWFGIGGFSMQPNLLAGPVPYLERDEIKHYLRALFNGFASAYRPGLNLLVEHPLPVLGVTAGAHFKTSDEANFSRWLKMMFVHESGNDLYIGKGIPREWFKAGKQASIKNCSTCFGAVSAEFSAERNKITCGLSLGLRKKPKKIFVRFRHPNELRIKKVLVNGFAYPNFDPAKEWVIFDKPVKIIRIEAFY